MLHIDAFPDIKLQIGDDELLLTKRRMEMITETVSLMSLTDWKRQQSGAVGFCAKQPPQLCTSESCNRLTCWLVFTNTMHASTATTDVHLLWLQVDKIDEGWEKLGNVVQIRGMPPS